MKLFLLAITFLFCFSSFSQDYKSAIGVKSGYPGIVTLNGKFFIKKKFALDNYIGVNLDAENRYLTAQTMVQYNFQIGKSTGYTWYAGLGPTAQYYIVGGYRGEGDVIVYDGFSLRADAALGIEFTPNFSNINIAMEVGPNFTFMPVTRLGIFANVALRYAFKRSNSVFKKI